jgi:hypothetical protein
MWKNTVEPGRPDMKFITHAQCMLDTYIRQHTHSKYVSLIAFPLLYEDALILLDTSIACLVVFHSLSPLVKCLNKYVL